MGGRYCKGGMYIVTPIGWVGNKTSILKIIYAVFPLSYQKYIEPFGGSGAVLLGKPKLDKFEVYNDFNSDLVNLFRVMKTRPMALIKELGFYPLNSRDDFNLLKDFFKGEDITGKYLDEELELTEIMLEPLSAAEIKRMRPETAQSYDVRRAANYLKLLRYSYSSSGKSFGCRPFDIRKLFKIINNLGKRLANTVIENQDFETLIKHYDSQQSFFYCDPPYYSSEYVYACQFTWEDHKRLADTLHSIKGKVLLSYNDCPEIREL